MPPTEQVRDALSELQNVELEESGLVHGLRAAVPEDEIGQFYRLVRVNGLEAQSKRLGDALVAHVEADWVFPDVGDKMRDPETEYGSPIVEVVDVLEDAEAATTYFDSKFGSRSVASANPHHPADAPVVRAKYVDGSDRVYSFPCTRLEEA
jgi:hypothetical protein